MVFQRSIVKEEIPLFDPLLDSFCRATHCRKMAKKMKVFGSAVSDRFGTYQTCSSSIYPILLLLAKSIPVSQSGLSVSASLW